MLFRRLISIFLISIAASRVLAATSPPSLFDPAKYMRVSEVRPGMKGYGISVFKGTKLERFDVEVVSVLKNFNPKDDVVLIRCWGADLEHTGAIAGMSGSPIYLKDDQGRERMIGAFAYGWPLVKDPIAGVQPIEYMLALPDKQKNARSPGPLPASPAAHPQIHWKLSDSIPLPGMKHPPRDYPLIAVDRFEPNVGILTGSTVDGQMQPLATPLMTSGFSSKLIAQFAPLFRPYGLTALQAGGGGSSSASPATQLDNVPMQPGSVLAAPLLTGDVDMTAVGTCTDVIGDRVFGFGHPFNNEGSINLPFGGGEINAVVAELRQSFKLGSMTRTMGTLTTDESVGISGHIGKAPPTMPIDLRIHFTDGTVDQHYHFDCVIHPKFTPLLSVAALSAALSGKRDLPDEHTLDFDLRVSFANGRSIQLKNVLTDDNPAALFLQLSAPLSAAAENPFAEVLPQKITGTVNVIPETRTAEILSINLPKLKYKPGELLSATMQYRPFHGGEQSIPVQLQLPRDLPDGQYQLVVSGWQRYLQDEQTSRPFRFDADSIDGVFEVLNEFESVRHDAVYLRLVRQADGVALGRVAMPRLPSSIRQVMLDAGRSDTTAFVSSEARVMPMPLVLDGAADFAITIEAPGHPDLSRLVRPEQQPIPVQPLPPANSGKKPDAPAAPPLK
ncbi:MAG: hypothetical protein JO353_04460 [Phycisphaerae bacterium]|nr:hypothetical protein [Phycisphaerae bacterium]